MRIHQIINGHEPVLAQAEVLNKTLRQLGHESAIFAPSQVAAMRDLRPLESLDPNQTDTLIYHACAHPELNKIYRDFSKRRLLIRDLLPSPHFLAPYSDSPYDVVTNDKQSLATLTDVTDHVFALSVCGHDESPELLELGFRSVSTLSLPRTNKSLREIPYDTTFFARLRDGCTNFLFTGPLTPERNVEDLIRVFASYRRHLNPRVRLILAGSQEAVDYNHALVDLINSFELQSCVLFTGAPSDPVLAACYRAANIFVNLSSCESEEWPFLEALRFDVPVVAYSTPDLSEWLGCGALVPTEDIRAVAATCHRVLTENALRHKILNAQQQRARILCDSQTTMARFTEQLKANL